MVDQELSKSEYEELLRQYVAICNKAIDQHQDFPYKAIWAAAFAQLHGKQVEFALHDDRPKACLQVDISSDHLDAQGPVEPCDKLDWTFDYSFLKSVVDNPETYISDPSKLDWSWLRMMSHAD